MPDWFRRIFALSIFEDEEKTRAAQILNSIGWVALVAVLILLLSRVLSGVWTSESSKIFFPVILLIVLVTQILIRLGHVRIASPFLIGCIWVALTIQAGQAQGARDVAVLAYPVVILLSGLLLGWRIGITTAVLSIASIWYFAFREAQGFYPIYSDSPYTYARDLTAIVVISSALGYVLIHRLNRSLSDAHLELQERLKAEEKLQTQARYLTALHDTTFGLLNRLELNPLLESILKRVSELMDTPHVALNLILPDKTALRQELGHGVFEQFDNIITGKNQGVVGKSWSMGKSFIIENYSEWDGRLLEVEGMRFTGVVGTPLKSGAEIIGVLLVAYKDQQKQFTQEKIILLERFAALASLAMDNARLYEEAQKEIEERIAAETDLRSSEERFRKVFQSSPVAICITTLEEGKLLDANESYWKLTGYDAQTSIGKTTEQLEMWDSTEDRSQFVQALKEKRSLINQNYIFAEYHTNEIRHSIAFYELINLKGQPCILSMFYDVTEQKQAQEMLESAEARKRAILDAIPDMIFEISKDGIFLDFVPSSEVTPLMPPSEFIGKKVGELLPPLLAEQVLFAVERSLATGQLHAFEYGLPPGEETQFFEARISKVSSDSAIMMVRDISQRKWVETEREELINELEQKNSELEQFTYTVSHDLKSPIITIRGFLGFLEHDATNGNIDRLRGDIKRISDATDRMQLLLNELLELSRIGRLVNPPGLTPFKEIVHEALSLVQGRIQSNRVQVHVEESETVVYGDHQRLVEVLQNLIDNAAKFTSQNPRIEIGQNGVEDNKPVFFVRDNGIGIDSTHHERIFGLFNKLDAVSEGTGIGLALVKRIIEIHGGRIWVQSEPEHGSTFFFTLPTGPAS